MYVFKEKDSEELIRMGIAPIKRDYWLEHIRKNDTSITRHTPASSRDEPKLKLSKRQAKKVGFLIGTDDQREYTLNTD